MSPSILIIDQNHKMIYHNLTVIVFFYIFDKIFPI